MQISILMCCPADSLDMNESLYIEALGTMYPRGYNLRCGSKAGAPSPCGMELSTTVLVTDPTEATYEMRKVVEDDLEEITGTRPPSATWSGPVSVSLGDLNRMRGASMNLPWAGPVKGIPVDATATIDMVRRTESEQMFRDMMQSVSWCAARGNLSKWDMSNVTNVENDKNLEQVRLCKAKQMARDDINANRQANPMKRDVENLKMKAVACGELGLHEEAKLLKRKDMLAALFDQNKRKPTDTATNYFAVSWSSSTVRFSEVLQIVDIADCMGVIYGSPGSAKTAQSKFFSKIELDKTAEFLQCDPSTLLYKVKWQDSARVRLAIKVEHMAKLTKQKMAQMPLAPRLASILEQSPLTVVNANSDAASRMNPTNEWIEEVQRDDYTASSMTMVEAVKGAESKLVLQSFNARIVADCAEAELRLTKAEIDKSLERVRLFKATQMAKDDIDANNAINQMKRDINQMKRDIENIKTKAMACEELGLHDEAKLLKRKLVDI